MPQSFDQGLWCCRPEIPFHGRGNGILIVRVPPYVPYAAIGDDACPGAVGVLFELKAGPFVRDLGPEVAFELFSGCFLVLSFLDPVGIVGQAVGLRLDDGASARQIDVCDPSVDRVARLILDIQTRQQVSDACPDEIFRLAP